MNIKTGPFLRRNSGDAQPGQRPGERAPALQQGGELVPALAGEAVVFPGRTVGHFAQVLLGATLPAQAPEEGVDGALLGVGKGVVGLAEQLLAVLVPLGKQVEQAQLNEVLFQHRAAPAPTTPMPA